MSSIEQRFVLQWHDSFLIVLASIASVPTGVIWTLAPIVTGAIVQATGSFEYVFAVGAALLLVSALSYGVFLKKPIEADWKYRR